MCDLRQKRHKRPAPDTTLRCVAGTLRHHIAAVCCSTPPPLHLRRSVCSGSWIRLFARARDCDCRIMEGHETNPRSRKPIVLLSNETATTCDLDTCERTLVGKTAKRSTVSCALESPCGPRRELRRCWVLRKMLRNGIDGNMARIRMSFFSARKWLRASVVLLKPKYTR